MESSIDTKNPYSEDSIALSLGSNIEQILVKEKNQYEDTMQRIPSQNIIDYKYQHQSLASNSLLDELSQQETVQHINTVGINLHHLYIKNKTPEIQIYEESLNDDDD